MELKLVDSRSISASEVAGLCGQKRWSNSNYETSRQRILHFLACSCRGISIKASYSAPRTSHENVNSVGQNGYLSGTKNPKINGKNGTHSILSSVESYVLPSYEDHYEGIVIDSERLPFDANVFASSLHVSLAHWKSKGKKGVWLKLPLEHSELVPIAVEEGFIYHHAEKKYVMLTYWIPDGPSMLPGNASHQVGVGAFVINNKNEVVKTSSRGPEVPDMNAMDMLDSQVLVVQEKHSPSMFSGIWKIPTGFIHESEEIYAGVVREVKEETGIDTEFEEVIAFR
ncbi:hypothetical protein ACLOJK_040787 [Asimina triloba]